MATAAPVTLHRLAATRIHVGGTAVNVAYGPVLGGRITNPREAEDQGLDTVEVIYIDVTGAAHLGQTPTTVPIQPGASYFIPPQTTNVSVNAASSGHRFSGYIVQPQTPYPPTPQPGTFPPSAVVTLTDTIPAYIYEEYDDDEDLVAFAESYNAIAQEYVSWFAGTPLAVYTSDRIAGPLLDWVALGLYGMKRPSLSSGRNRDKGAYNTYSFNTMAYNGRVAVGPADIAVVSDDIFKRIMTWNFYKGDGPVFSIRWLKRRIMRFLIGPNGSAPNIDQTYDISVSIAGSQIAIRITVGTRTIIGGAVFNRFGYNTSAYNAVRTRFQNPQGRFQYAAVLKEAIDAGVLQLPIQYEFTVLI